MHVTRSVFLLAAAAAAASLPAHAQPGGKATLHLKGAGNPLEVRVAREALEAALTARKQLGFLPLQELLEPRAEREKLVKEADAQIEKGRVAIENLEVAEGVAALNKALELRERAFDLIAGDPESVHAHAQLLADLAVAHFLAGDTKKAEQTLGGAFVLAPKLEFDKKKHPPQMKRLFDSTRFLLDEMGTGELAVATDPEGAAVRVNGVLVGYAPVQAKQISAGRNLVTVARPGYATRTVPVDAEGSGKATKVRVLLTGLPGGIASELAGAARGEASACSTAARRLGVAWLFVGSARSREEKVDVTLSAYDAAGQRMAGQVQGSLLVPSLERDAQALVSSLLAIASRPPAAVAKTTSGPSAFSRFYRSPYFWPVVGGVLAAAAVGTGLGVYFGTRSETSGDRDRRFVIFY